VDALERCFEELSSDYLDPFRQPVTPETAGG